MNIDAQTVTDNTIAFLKNVFKKTNLSKAIIGVSGGIDSAVSLTLVTKALGPESVYPYLLPYGTFNKQGVDDALLVIKHCNIPTNNVNQIDIQPHVDSITSYDPTMTELRKGNIMARTRMIFLFDAAKKHGGLVIGTENKSEHYLGYYTRFGDEASDVEPLRSLYKTQVYQVAEYLQIPQPLITKAPTAGLWEGQTDEQEFGFSYVQADKVLSEYIERGRDKEEIVLSTGMSVTVIETIISRYLNNLYKQSLPYVFD